MMGDAESDGHTGSISSLVPNMLVGDVNRVELRGWKYVQHVEGVT